MNGIILLDKPPGISSARAVAWVKRLLPKSTKVGHAGTLDPFASGLLILLIGQATRQSEMVMTWPKTYQATIQLGVTSPTDDGESAQTIANTGFTIPTESDVAKTLGRFVGTIEQRPPAYSALKVQGKRACDRLRDGQTVELASRQVRIDTIDLLGYEWPRVYVIVTCGRGTYIRALARDVGTTLGCGGLLCELRRTRIGGCSVEDACVLQQLTSSNVTERVLELKSL